jgi:heptose-I-phosphate ethanolaminephosphotransferase
MMDLYKQHIVSIKNIDWKGLIWQYLFFWYFAGIIPLVTLVSGTADTIASRSAFLMSALWLAPTLIFPHKTRLISAGIGLILWPFAILSLGYYYIYRQEFSQSVLFVAFESNAAESSEYVANYLSWGLVLSLLLYSVAAYYLWKKIRPVHLTKSNVWALSSLIVIAPFISPLYAYNAKSAEGFTGVLKQHMEASMPWQFLISYADYKNQLQDMQQLLSAKSKIPPLQNLNDKLANQAATLVLVIGESTNRQRMSLYGYQRPTTPNLDKMRGDLLAFTDVISPRPFTVEALQQALTFADQEHPDLHLTQPSIMHMMKQAGYKTYWITNQQTIKKNNTMLAAYSKMMDEQYYLNNTRSGDSSQYDSSVFEPFEQVLKQPAPRKFIIVHLLGTHMKYQFRYPDDYAKFTDRKGVPAWVKAGEQLAAYNSYDNAVLYNDYVVSTLINTLASTKSNSLMVYFSDHGEEVYDTEGYNFRGRLESMPLPSMYTIPFIIWASPKWKDNHSESLQISLDRPYSISHFIYSWADLAGLTFDGYDPTKSIVNKEFKEYKRLVGDPHIKSESFDFDQLKTQVTVKK